MPGIRRNILYGVPLPETIYISYDMVEKNSKTVYYTASRVYGKKHEKCIQFISVSADFLSINLYCLTDPIKYFTETLSYSPEQDVTKYRVK